MAIRGVPDVEVAGRAELAGGLAVRDIEIDVGPARWLRLAGAEKRHPLGGGPGSGEHRSRDLGHLRRLILARSRGKAPELGKVHERGLVAQVGDERDVLSIRRPASTTDVIRRSREAGRLAAFDVDDPDARELVAIAAAVDLPGVVADAPGDRVGGLADEKTLVPAASHEQHAFAVGRTLGGTGAIGKVGELARLATVEPHEPHLR